MSLSSFILSFLRNGPNVMLYPGAFEPYPREVHLPSAWGLQYEDLTLTTADREYDIRPTVVMFHGNCDNIGHTLPLAQRFSKRLRCNVLMLSPRGYGLSEGKPSTKGFQRDADAALNYVLSHPKLSRTPIILYGQSMGGAVAIDLASRHADKISALIVENTFTSLRRLIRDILPVFALAAPFFRQWNSSRRMENLPRSVALLMLSGQRDNVVPPAHMRQLWEVATMTTPSLKASKFKKWLRQKTNFGQPKSPREGRFVEFPRGTHNDTWDNPAYWDAIEAFIENLPIDSLAN